MLIERAVADTTRGPIGFGTGEPTSLRDNPYVETEDPLNQTSFTTPDSYDLALSHIYVEVLKKRKVIQVSSAHVEVMKKRYLMKISQDYVEVLVKRNNWQIFEA